MHVLNDYTSSGEYSSPSQRLVERRAVVRGIRYVPVATRFHVHHRQWLWKWEEQSLADQHVLLSQPYSKLLIIITNNYIEASMM